MKILVTRPSDEAPETVKQLSDMGHEAYAAPLFAISLIADEQALPDDATGAIFTSKSAVRGFAQSHKTRDITAWCVGAETSRAAQQAGFDDVVSADGNAEDLAALLRNEANGTLIRIAGSNTPDTLDDILSEEGFTIDRRVLYHVTPVTEFDEVTLELLRFSTLDGVLFFSPSAASIFAHCAAKSELTESCRRMTAWCISDRASEALADLPWRGRVVAPRPSAAGLLSLISQAK
jgi:uroporphyrinogen-III synthase